MGGEASAATKLVRALATVDNKAGHTNSAILTWPGQAIVFSTDSMLSFLICQLWNINVGKVQSYLKLELK